MTLDTREGILLTRQERGNIKTNKKDKRCYYSLLPVCELVMVEGVQSGCGRGQLAASTGRGHHRGCAGEAVTSLGGGPPAGVEAEEARGQDTQLQEDHSSSCNRINGTDNVCYAIIVLPAVITTGRVVQTSSLSLSSPRMKTEIRRQLKFSISSAELELF